MASQKTYLARTMMSKAEIKRGISPFDSAAWNERKIARAEREQKKRDAAVARMEEKKSGEKAFFGNIFK